METSLALTPGERRFALLKNSVQLLEHLVKAGRLLCVVVQDTLAARVDDEPRTPVNSGPREKQVWEDLSKRGNGRRIRLIEVGDTSVTVENVKTGAQTVILRNSFDGPRPRFKLVPNGS